MKINIRILCSTVFAFMLCCVSVDSVMAQQSAPSVSSIVLFGMPSVKEIKQDNHLQKNECLQKYLMAIPAKSFLLSAAPSGQEDTLNYRRRNMEEQMVILLGNKTREEAGAFAQSVPLCLEWEGMSENPINEADFADHWLQKNPNTPIAPFLYLFQAHRLRAGYEAAQAGSEKDLRPVLAAKFKESLQKAMAFNNPLISCIAKDLEEQAYVYLEGSERP